MLCSKYGAARAVYRNCGHCGKDSGEDRGPMKPIDLNPKP